MLKDSIKIVCIFLGNRSKVRFVGILGKFEKCLVIEWGYLRSKGDKFCDREIV